MHQTKATFDDNMHSSVCTCLITKYKLNFSVPVCIEIIPIIILSTTTPIPYEIHPHMHAKFSPKIINSQQK